MPGLKDDFHIQVSGDLLIVSGEKRVEREASEGHFRVRQCAYGSFQRTIPLPCPVIVEDAPERRAQDRAAQGRRSTA